MELLNRPLARYVVPNSVWHETLAELRTRSLHAQEGLVFWLGVVQEQDAYVRRCWVPVVAATATRVAVRSEEVARMVLAATDREEVVLAQVHSHLGAAFHSSVDDSGSVSLRKGFLSVVVPRGGDIQEPGEALFFEHLGGTCWRRLARQEVAERIRLFDSHECAPDVRP
ncbi:MAG: hypothetical protein ACOY3F_02825 [Bacillota bacterium]